MLETENKKELTGPDLRRPLIAGRKFPRCKDFLPQVNAFIDYYSWLLGCPVNYLAAGVVFAVGVAIGKKATIKVPGYSNNANMFMAIVGRSGANKSTPIATCLQPLIDIDSLLHDEYLQAKAKVDAANREIFKVNRRKEAEQQPLQPQPPELSIFLSDATPEKRNATLAAIDTTNLGLMIYFDELVALFKQFGRYNNNSEVEDLLTLYDNKRLKVSRKGEATMIAKRPCLSIIGTIQTNVLKETFAAKQMKNSGFNQRWMFVLPETDEIPEETAKQEEPSHGRWWSDFIGSIFHMEGTRDITLSAEAYTTYLDWKNALIDESNHLSEGDDTGGTDDFISYSRAILAKAPIYCLRWALACHFLTPESQSDSISLDEIKYAIKAAEYFIKTAGKVQSLLEGSTDQKSSTILYNAWLHSQQQGMTVKQFAENQGVTFSYVYRVIRENKAKNG